MSLKPLHDQQANRNKVGFSQSLGANRIDSCDEELGIKTDREEEEEGPFAVWYIVLGIQINVDQTPKTCSQDRKDGTHLSLSAYYPRV